MIKKLFRNEFTKKCVCIFNLKMNYLGTETVVKKIVLPIERLL